jgi:ABC-2 type transport system ATP-binding protein
MIRLNHVNKSFDGFQALTDLTMSVPRGSVYGLIGPNGAGKSTAIRHIIGAYRPDSGEVLVDGRPVYENPELKSRIGVIPDDFYYFMSASTRDMMRFYWGIYPRFSVERYEKLRPAFPEVDEKRPIRRLSKGMQKQVAFWLALSSMPDLMVLDEPVDGLDPVMRRQVWSLMQNDVKNRGVTILVSSHNLRELEDVCDYVGVLSHGRLMLERSLTELQGNIVKVQIVFDGGGELPRLPVGMDVLHVSSVGRIYTLIVRGEPAETTNRLATLGPLYMEAIPLTLEEIFIYELGGDDYAVKELVL